MTAPPGDAIGSIEVFADPADGIEAPTGIIGDGADIWFTSIANGRIGRLRPATGRVETFVDPGAGIALPANIFPAADGRIWVTCLGSDALASIDPDAADPAASITVHRHPDLQRPVALKAAPDGRLWFSLRGGAGAIGTLDPVDAEPVRSVRTYTAASIADPSALFVHPTAGVWWVNAGNGTIGHLDPHQPDPAATIDAIGPWPEHGTPRAWAIDRTDRFWVTTQDRPGLLTFDPTAPDADAVAASARWVTDDRLQTPDGIWCSADGALWIADTEANAIVRHDPEAKGDAWQSFGGPPSVVAPFDIKPLGGAGDRDLWFTNKDGNTIGRIVTGS